MDAIRLRTLPLMGIALLLGAGSALAECSPSDKATAEQSYSTAYQFVTANQWAEAIPSLEQAVAACPEHWPSVELLAAAKMRTKAYLDAGDWYEKLIAGKYDGVIARVDSRVLGAYGYVLLKNRNWERAETIYEAILGQDPNNQEAHERLVYVYDRAGNRRKAIEHLEALYAMSDGDAQKDYAKKIGNAYKLLGDNETARQWFELAGGASSGMFSIGVENMRKKEWAKAVDAFQSYLQGKPDSAPAWKNLAQCQQKLGRREDAIASFEKALSIDPERHDVASALGFLYSELERWSKAGELAQKAIDTWPENDRYKDSMYFLMGKVLEKRDANYEGAIAMFEKAKGDPYWGDLAVKEIDRQRQLIEIRSMQKSGR